MCFILSRYGLGVADGVWQWSEHGIDAGQFSKALMDSAREQVRGNVTSVSDVVALAAEKVKRDKVLGSSTFCVSLVDMVRGTMQIANLGDSGVLIFGRKGGVKLKTSQQEHSFGYEQKHTHVHSHCSLQLPLPSPPHTLPLWPSPCSEDAMKSSGNHYHYEKGG